MPIDPAALAAPATNYPALRAKAAIAAAEAYFHKQAEKKRLEAELKALKDQLLKAMAGAPVATAGVRVLSLTAVPPSPPGPDITITKQMVGQVIPGTPGRAGYTQLVVK